jgi:hypothetical protein
MPKPISPPKIVVQTIKLSNIEKIKISWQRRLNIVFYFMYTKIRTYICQTPIFALNQEK